MFPLGSQGANRPDGIGFSAVVNLIKDPNAYIVAAVRDPDAATELTKLGQANQNRIALVKMDVTSLDSVKVRPSRPIRPHQVD